MPLKSAHFGMQKDPCPLLSAAGTGPDCDAFSGFELSPSGWR